MPKILVADDNTNIQKMVTLAFQERGIEVVAVGNGEAAVRRLPDLKPDMVLADIFMPVRNGYEVCEYIKKDDRFAQIPVILLLGAFDPLDEKEARRVGADGILKKPFVPPDPLIAMVTAVLEKNPAIAAELQKKKKSPAAESAAPKAAASGPMKPLSRLSQMSPDVTELVPEAALASNEKSSETSAPPSAEDEIDATPQWRRSAMKFEISSDAASQSVFMDELAAETPSFAPALEEKRPPVANPLASATAPFEAAIQLNQEAEPEEVPSQSGSRTGSNEERELPAVHLAAQQPIETKEQSPKNDFVIEPDVEPSFEIIEAAIVPDVQPEEQAIYEAPVVAAEPWQPPASVETEHDVANVVPPAEPQHEEIPFYDPPPSDVPVAEVALEDDISPVSASALQESDPPIQPPALVKKLGDENAIEPRIARSSGTPHIPEPAFSSRTRGWMESIVPSGTPEGGWLASVADVLAETDKGEPRATSAKASAIVAEPLVDESATSLETPLETRAKNSFLPELDEPFFLDEASTGSAAEASVTQSSETSRQDNSPDVGEQESSTASISKEESQIAETASPENTSVAGVNDTGSVVEAQELVSVEQEQGSDVAREQRVAEYQEPDLIRPLSVAVVTDPLLVRQEDEVLRQPSSAYGTGAQQIPPPYVFLASTPASEADQASPSSETAAIGEPEFALGGASTNEISSAEHTATEVVSDHVNETDAPRSSLPVTSWDASAQEIAQHPAEPPLQQTPTVSPVVSEGEAAIAPISPVESEENSWFPTAAPPNLEVLREIPFLTPSREFLTGNAEKSWNIPVIAPQAHETQTEALEARSAQAPLPTLVDKGISTELESAADRSKEVETIQRQDSASAGTGAAPTAAKDIAVDEVVRKVLDRLEPRLHELLKQGLLKPLVESIIHEEPEHK